MRGRVKTVLHSRSGTVALAGMYYRCTLCVCRHDTLFFHKGMTLVHTTCISSTMMAAELNHGLDSNPVARLVARQEKQQRSAILIASPTPPYPSTIIITGVALSKHIYTRQQEKTWSPNTSKRRHPTDDATTT